VFPPMGDQRSPLERERAWPPEAAAAPERQSQLAQERASVTELESATDSESARRSRLASEQPRLEQELARRLEAVPAIEPEQRAQPERE
jgi:hypothetical protein